MLFLRHIFSLLISIILCGNLFSQSIFLDVSQLQPVADYNFVHGFGVIPSDSYLPDVSREKACEFALEELNSNKFISVYIEQFKTDGNTSYTFPELSVNDTSFTFSYNIVKADSFEIAGSSFCIAADKHTPSKQFQIPSLEELKISPIKKNGYWYAMGVEKGSGYNPYRSWIKSKNNALKDLTKSIITLVQSSTVSSGFHYAEFTYLKSFVIYKDIMVARRYITPENELVSVLAIAESNIEKLN